VKSLNYWALVTVIVGLRFQGQKNN